MLWQNTDGQAAIWLMNGTTPTSEALVGTNPGSSWQIVGTGDFTGDGKSDILFQNTDGQAAIWLMNGTTPTAEAVAGPNPGPSWHVAGTGDFTGNGISDILWQNTDGQAAIWLMNGTTPTAEALVGPNPGPSWHIAGTGDYNGDGKFDILWQNASGQADIWMMNGTTPIAEALVGPTRAQLAHPDRRMSRPRKWHRQTRAAALKLGVHRPRRVAVVAAFLLTLYRLCGAFTDVGRNDNLIPLANYRKLIDFRSAHASPAARAERRRQSTPSTNAYSGEADRLAAPRPSRTGAALHRARCREAEPRERPPPALEPAPMPAAAADGGAAGEQTDDAVVSCEPGFRACFGLAFKAQFTPISARCAGAT